MVYLKNKYKEMIKKFENFNNDKEELSREEKIQFILDNNENIDDSIADYDDLNALPDNLLDKYYNNLLRSLNKMNESDGSSTAVAGSGTAVGGASGSFVSAMGTSVSGGDSGSAFATNSTISGMGPIISAQPSSIPGDVAGSTIGSGDIGYVGGVYSKTPAGRKKNKKGKRRENAINKLNKLYTTNYVQTTSGGKIIQNWKTFNNK